METNFYPFTPGFPVRDNSTRAQFTILFLRVRVVLILCAIALNVALALSVPSNGHTTVTARLVTGAFGMLNLFFDFVLIILFLLWLYRAHANLHRIGVRGLSYSQPMAAIAWFIPFANLFIPYQIVKETWKVTQQVYNDEQYVIDRGSIIGYWWGTLIVSLLPAAFAGFFAAVGFYQPAYIFGAFSGLFNIFSAIYAVRMVRRLSQMEKDLMNRIQERVTGKFTQYAQQYAQQQYAYHTGMNVQWPATPPPAWEQPEPGSVTFDENKERAQFSIFTLYWLIGVVTMYGAINGYMLVKNNQENYNDVFSTSEKILWKLFPFALVSFLAAFTLLSLWMSRAYRNLQQLGIKSLAYQSWMAFACWYIPLGNIALPYLMVNEIAKHTSLALRDETETEPVKPPPLMAWWIFCLAGFALLVLRQFTETNNYYMLSSDVQDRAVFGIAAALCGVIALGFSITVIKKISKAETDLFARVEKKFAQPEEILPAENPDKL